MTNEKLGFLMVVLPEPRSSRYYFAAMIHDGWDIFYASPLITVCAFAYSCTQEEAKKYPQFRWVALEDLHDQ